MAYSYKYTGDWLNSVEGKTLLHENMAFSLKVNCIVQIFTVSAIWVTVKTKGTRIRGGGARVHTSCIFQKDLNYAPPPSFSARGLF